MRTRCAIRRTDSLNGREKVVAKNGPFSLTFCQIVALMLLHRSVFAGCLLVAILFPPFVEMKVALSMEEESQRTFQGGNVRQNAGAACRRGPSSGRDSFAGASGAPRR
jgi:hypothetical protein